MHQTDDGHDGGSGLAAHIVAKVAARERLAAAPGTQEDDPFVRILLIHAPRERVGDPRVLLGDSDDGRSRHGVGEGIGVGVGVCGGGW